MKERAALQRFLKLHGDTPQTPNIRRHDAHNRRYGKSKPSMMHAEGPNDLNLIARNRDFLFRFAQRRIDTCFVLLLQPCRREMKSAPHVTACSVDRTVKRIVGSSRAITGTKYSGVFANIAPAAFKFLIADKMRIDLTEQLANALRRGAAQIRLNARTPIGLIRCLPSLRQSLL